ncbi:MAG: AMP-binding protein [Polyangiaceae bacterium]|nr:AMP-binding protein [Polyangiaceae bacterium]
MTNTAVSNGAGELLPPLLPSRVLSGRRLVVVGGTGFLGKVWVAMLLHRFPDIEHLYLLVRPKRDQTAEERFWSQIATSPTFDPLREAHPGPAFEAFLKQKITPVAGDVVVPNLGLDPALIESLKGRIEAVVNVAGVVDFNPPLDEALEVNAFGVNNLVSLAKVLGAAVLHTSTCYVAGYRTGLIEETDPRNIPFPRAEGETWFGAAKPERTLDRSHWDPQREIDECLDLIKQARHRCEDAFRQSHFLDQAKRNLTARGEPNRGTALEDELAKVKRRFIEDQLSAAGKERAVFWGWPNIYTYTKSIGEQVLAGSGVPFTIVRPAVIESSVEFPFKGWNEGINTSAPIIYIAMKGDPLLPGGSDVHLDIIPVDMVASGMIASLCELLEGTAPAVYQYGSSDTNACKMTRYYELIGLYKRKLVREGKKTSLFDYVSSRFEPLGLTLNQYNTFGPHRVADAMAGLSGLLEKASIGPARLFFKPAASALKSAAKQRHKQGDIFDLFLPFTCEADYIFSCANTRAAIHRMPLEERARFLWDPEKIDWREWMWDVHMPGLERHVFPEIEQRLQREVKPLRPYDTLLDVLDEMADKHDHAVALQRVEKDGLSRTSFREWREAAFATAARLAALGIKPGDRVIVSGENQPAWPIAYFGILRAGAVAVPVDPDLDAARLLNIARSSGARVALWDAGVEENAGSEVTRALPALKAFDLALFTAAPAAGEEALAAPEIKVTGDDLASVIYTSGTTGDPKGVMLTHGNFTSLIAALAPLFPLKVSDRVLSVLPLHHTFEFACGLLLPLSRGARIIYVSEVSAEGLSEGLTKGRATALAGVPALWQMLERRIHSRVKEQGPAASKVFDWALELNRLVGEKSGANLGRLFFGSVHTALGGNVRWLISGGAALPKDTAQFFSGLGLPLSEGYGLTEAAPVLTVAKASMKTKPGHVGKAIPGVEIKIANPDERGVGEVLARGPNVMKGYANDEAATKRTIDDDGWLHTGDLGKLDRRSQLVIVGRQKEVIVAANGENVYPDDVEAMLGKVKGVREIAIVGIDDGKGGERVACLASPDLPAAGDDGETPAARADRHKKALEALREAIQELPKYCQPAVVHLYDADLPRTATRKVKRSEVRAILTRISSAAAPIPTSAEAGSGSGPARHAIAAIANRKPAEIAPSMSLKADLGFDSLMAMELSVALEAQAGGKLDMVALAKCETVADVEAVVGASLAAADHHEADEVTEEPEEPIKLPPAVQDVAKDLLTRAQMGFYGHVMRPKVYGRAYIPHNRSTIVISNHSSHLDMGFVKYALGTYGDGIVSLAAQDYFFEGGKWRRAYFENFTNLSPFDRKGGLRQAIRQAGEVIEQGKTVLIFPEGTRSTDGSIHDFKPVIGHLALTHGVDILPVYLGGTYESWPKGRAVPTRRDIVARIGPPLEIADLRRLTAGMKLSPASRKVTEIAREAVLALKDGKVLDLRRLGAEDAALAPKEHPLVLLFRELSGKFVAGRVSQPVTYYFTLGAEDEAKWSMRIDEARCEIKNGKPPNGVADCVLKTTPEIFTKIVREAYTPSPMEFMTGAVKSNDISLLQTFQKAFGLG